MIDIDTRLVINECDALQLGALLWRVVHGRDLDENDEFFLTTWSQLFTLHGKLQIALSSLHDEGEQTFSKTVARFKKRKINFSNFNSGSSGG
jgi:hypothetical protein